MMSMVPRMLYLSNIALELDTDPKTMARKLRGLEPDDDTAAKPRWLLSTAIRHIYEKGTVSPQEAKARLDLARAEEVTLRLALAHKEVAQVVHLERAAGQLASIMAAALNSIPLRLQKANQKLTSKEVDDIRRLLISVADEVSEYRIDFEEWKGK